MVSLLSTTGDSFFSIYKSLIMCINRCEKNFYMSLPVISKIIPRWASQIQLRYLYDFHIKGVKFLFRITPSIANYQISDNIPSISSTVYSLHLYPLTINQIKVLHPGMIFLHECICDGELIISKSRQRRASKWSKSICVTQLHAQARDCIKEHYDYASASFYSVYWQEFLSALCQENHLSYLHCFIYHIPSVCDKVKSSVNQRHLMAKQTSFKLDFHLRHVFEMGKICIVFIGWQCKPSMLFHGTIYDLLKLIL